MNAQNGSLERGSTGAKSACLHNCLVIYVYLTVSVIQMSTLIAGRHLWVVGGAYEPTTNCENIFAQLRKLKTAKQL